MEHNQMYRRPVHKSIPSALLALRSSAGCKIKVRFYRDQVCTEDSRWRGDFGQNITLLYRNKRIAIVALTWDLSGCIILCSKCARAKL